MLQRILLFFVFVYFTCINCFDVQAQASFFKNIVFDKEKREAKLSTIFQDKKGYIWLGTSVGICKYDGISFKYLENDSNLVTSLAEDNNGILWMGHFDGRMEYLYNNEIKKFLPDEGLPKIKITDIVFDKENRLWFSTYGEGVYCYDNKIMYNINHADGLSDNNVYDLLLVDGKIWVATDAGISICSLQKGKKVITVLNEKNGLPDNIVKNMKQDKLGNIWIALQDKGICYVEKKSTKIVVPAELGVWKYGQVNEVLPTNREVLIGTEEHGVIAMHFGLPLLFDNEANAKQQIAENVQHLLLDKNEQVWMVANNLLSLANTNRFQFIAIPPPWQDAVKAITADNSGGIWFANSKGLFFKKDNISPVRQLKLPLKINYASIVCLYADEYMDLWIGTYNNGLYQYTAAENKLQHYSTVNGMVDNNVFSIAGRGNEIWLGTLGGATKLDMSSGVPVFTNFTKQNGLSNNYVYNVFIDSKGNKWFATDGSGVSKLDNNGFHHYKNIPGLDNNIAYTITEDIFGGIWFTGRNSGLFVLRGNTFKQYGLKNGLHDNEILNVVADNSGNLLITHPDGIELFNIKKEYFTFYGEESGFANINPQINAFCTTSRDAIFIGAADKIIQYYPAAKQLPEIVMNKIEIFFNPINFTEINEFSYEDHHISFDYTSLWFTDPEAVGYQYQLQGYGKDWISTKDHIVTFPNLQPGQYTFKVKASINNNFTNVPVLTYSFTIDKPIWKTNWFRILGVLFIGSLIYYFVNVRIRLIRYKQEKEKQKLEAQLDLLKNQLNPHFLFNSFNTLINIIDKDKQLAMEFAEKLSDFYRDIVMIQDREMVTVEEELNLLNNYIYLQQKRFSNNLQLSVSIFDEHRKAFIPPLTLQLLAENALKHNTVNESNPLVIKIESAQSFLIVSNNITLLEHPVKSAGIGLKNIQWRVLLLTGQEVKLVQTATEFNVIIPLK